MSFNPADIESAFPGSKVTVLRDGDNLSSLIVFYGKNTAKINFRNSGGGRVIVDGYFFDKLGGSFVEILSSATTFSSMEGGEAISTLRVLFLSASSFHQAQFNRLELMQPRR